MTRSAPPGSDQGSGPTVPSKCAGLVLGLASEVQKTCHSKAKRIFHSGDKRTIQKFEKNSKMIDEHLSDYCCITFECQKFRDKNITLPLNYSFCS